MIRYVLLILLSVLFLFPVFGQYKQAAFWSSIQSEIDVHKDFAAKIEAGYRRTNNFHDIDKFYAEAGIEYEPFNELRIATEYRFAEKYHSEDDYFAERHRLMLKVKSRLELKAFRFMWTGKYQLNFFDKAEHDWNTTKTVSHLRNRFQLKYNKKSARLEPYVYYEFFVPLNEIDAFYLRTDAYRLAGGLEIDINRDNSMKVFFIYEEEKEDRYDILNFIYGIAYALEF